MSIVIYNKSLNNFHDVAHAQSVQFLEYYNGIGKATIVLPMDAYNIAAAENNGVIYDTLRDMSFTVQNIQYDTKNNTLTINAYTCNWILNKRVLAEKKYFSNVETGVYDVVSANLRGLPAVRVDTEKGFSEHSDSVLFGGQLLDKIIPVMEAAGIGHRMWWDPDAREHVFTLYKGRDLTEGIHAVTFSEEQGTAANLIVTSDGSVFKNHIFVQGKLRDDTEIVEEVGIAQNPEKCELWMRNTYNQEADETEAAFRLRLQDAGKEEIAARVFRETFSVTVDPSEYGTAYRLGDVVMASAQRFGVEMSCRITGVKYTLDANGEKIELILGEPVLTALTEAKLNNG